MPKVNPWAFERPVMLEETRSFEDTRHGVTVTLTLRALNVPTMMTANEAAERQVELLRPAGLRLGAPTGEPVQLTEGIIKTLCLLELMQVVDEADRYYLPDFVGMMVTMERVFVDIAVWASELQERAEANQGNGSAASMDPLSSPRPTTKRRTRKSSVAPTHSSVA